MINKVRVTSIIFCLSLIFFSQKDIILAQHASHRSEITVVVKNKALRDVLHEIMAQSNRKFVFNDELVEGLHITCHLTNVPFEKAIKEIMNQAQISFEIMPVELIVLFNDKSLDKNTFSQKPSRFIPTQFTPPTLQGKRKPHYPMQAQWRGLEGNVDMDLLVDKRGVVQKAIIKSSSGYEILDEAAIKFAKTLKYDPARRQGKPIDVWVSRIMQFQLIEKNYVPADDIDNTQEMTRFADLSTRGSKE